MPLSHPLAAANGQYDTPPHLYHAHSTFSNAFAGQRASPRSHPRAASPPVQRVSSLVSHTVSDNQPMGGFGRSGTPGSVYGQGSALPRRRAPSPEGSQVGEQVSPTSPAAPCSSLPCSKAPPNTHRVKGTHSRPVGILFLVSSRSGKSWEPKALLGSTVKCCRRHLLLCFSSSPQYLWQLNSLRVAGPACLHPTCQLAF